MKREVVEQLIGLNRDFYAGVADGFARSRTRPQPGFFELADGWGDWFEAFGGKPDLLDVGCGEGRLGRFFGMRGLIDDYVGVDFSGELLEIAGTLSSHTFVERDITDPAGLLDLGQFGAVACMAALQHVPSLARRQAVVRALVDCLPVGGCLLMSNWQFLQSDRQRRKIRDWGLVGLDKGVDLEEHDYLLSWGKDGNALRYVCWLGLDELVRLGGNAGISLIHHFYNDGKEGNLNLYTIFQKKQLNLPATSHQPPATFSKKLTAPNPLLQFSLEKYKYEYKRTTKKRPKSGNDCQRFFQKRYFTWPNGCY